ncbi:MAG TPA: hypothetical protein VHT91_23525 [Kofleriaceae bacterium]|jgi:hypothetical protein|nr:hypothetical protein [Kofleriaceae bacterium]
MYGPVCSPGDSSLDIDRDGLRVGVLGLDTTIGPAVDADLEAERIAAVCGADTTEWVRRSDAVIVIASHEDTLSAARFMNHGVPLVWLCRGCPQALSMRSRRGRTYLVVSAPQLFADTGGGALASAGDPFGYSAGRLWVSDDQAHVRIWHRCLSGDCTGSA